MKKLLGFVLQFICLVVGSVVGLLFMAIVGCIYVLVYGPFAKPKDESSGYYDSRNLFNK